jgi:hypothetical protein
LAVNVAITGLIVPSEEQRCTRAAEVTIDAGVIDVEPSVNIFGKPVGEISHKIADAAEVSDIDS